MPSDNTNWRSMASRIFCRSLVITNSSSPSVKYLSDSAGRSVCDEFSLSGRKQRRIFCKLKPWRARSLTTLRQTRSLKEYRRLGAAPFGELDRRPDKILLVPILQLAQAHADNPARGFAVVRFPSQVRDQMKTRLFL